MFKKKVRACLEIVNRSNKTGQKIWVWEKRVRGLGGPDKISLLVSALGLQRFHPQQFKYKLLTVTLGLELHCHSLHWFTLSHGINFELKAPSLQFRFRLQLRINSNGKDITGLQNVVKAVKKKKFPKQTVSPGSRGKKGGTGSHATCDGAFVQLHSTATQRVRLHD